jgi:hypothetical protein
VIANLSTLEKVQIVHCDGNLHLYNAAAGSVLVGFLIQGTVHVSGEEKHPASSDEMSADMSAGVLCMVGLVVDWDVWVEDDQSVVIVDLCESPHSPYFSLVLLAAARVWPDFVSSSLQITSS